MKYKKTAKTLREIGRDLNIEAVVTGSVLRSGGKVRIIAHLIRAATDEQLWAESYERDLQNVLALQNDVARAIVAEIKIQMTPLEKARFSQVHSIDPAAHEAYLKGRYYWHKGRTPEYMSKAIEYFHQAIDKEPRYAAAYAGLGDTYIALGFFGMLLSEDVTRNARPLVMKALELDPQSAEAHAALGRLRGDYDWDWVGAESEYRRAIELNPNYSEAQVWYATLLIVLGRSDEAIVHSKRGVESDPVSTALNLGQEFLYYLAHRFDQAVEQGRKTIELDPSYAPAYETVAEAYEAKGVPETAFSFYQKSFEAEGYGPDTIAALKRAFDSGGMKGYWRERLEMEKKEQEETGSVWALTMAQIYARLGARDEAFAWLEKMYSERHERLRLLKADPVFDGLHSDPRFTDLLRRIGLPL